MPFILASSGAVDADAFGSNTAANYDTLTGTFTVSGGVATMGSATDTAVRITLNTPKCITMRVKRASTYAGGPYLGKVSPLAAAADVDGYALYITGTQWCLRRFTDNVLAAIGVDSSADLPADGAWAYARIFVDDFSGYVKARFGAAKLTQAIDTTDTAWAAPFFSGLRTPAATGLQFDDRDARTSVYVFANSTVPNGWYVRVTDANGDTQVFIGSGSGTVGIMADYLLAPFAKVELFDANPATTGRLVGALLATDYPNLGHGDTYGYTALKNAPAVAGDDIGDSGSGFTSASYSFAPEATFTYNASLPNSDQQIDDFLWRWTHNKMVDTKDGAGVITHTLRNDTDTANYCHWTFDPATGITTPIIIDNVLAVLGSPWCDDFLRKWTQNQRVKGVVGTVTTFTMRNDGNTADYCHWTYDSSTGVRSAIVLS
jgi:hypothetical protein